MIKYYMKWQNWYIPAAPKARTMVPSIVRALFEVAVESSLILGITEIAPNYLVMPSAITACET